MYTGSSVGLGSPNPNVNEPRKSGTESYEARHTLFRSGALGGRDRLGNHEKESLFIRGALGGETVTGIARRRLSSYMEHLAGRLSRESREGGSLPNAPLKQFGKILKCRTGKRLVHRNPPETGFFRCGAFILFSCLAAKNTRLFPANTGRPLRGLYVGYIRRSTTGVHRSLQSDLDLLGS